MRKASFKSTFRLFFLEASTYDLLIQDITNFNFQEIADAKGRQKLVEAVAFRIHVAWEVFVENLLIDCLNQDTSQYASYKAMDLPKHLRRDVCELLLTGIGFLDVKGVGDIKGVAKKVIVPQYNPFNSIDKEDASMIDEFYVIRNYLAHQSRVSRRALLNDVYKKKRKIHRFIEPGNFLIASEKKRELGQSVRLHAYLRAFFNAAETMESYLDTR